MKKTINKIESAGDNLINWMSQSEWRAASVIVAAGSILIYLLTLTSK